MLSFFRTPSLLPWAFPGLRWRIPTQAKELYLTFDDGPVPGPTEFVLEELSKANAKATFFSIGDNARKHPDIFAKILGAKHSIGNHTFNHISGWKTNNEEYLSNVKKCSAELTRQGAQPVFLFRPPYGRIKPAQVRSLAEYTIIMWDVLTHDYAKSFSPDVCLTGSIRATRAGSIIVFHDSMKAEKNLKFVLPRYLDHFGGLGYTFKSIDL